MKFFKRLTRPRVNVSLTTFKSSVALGEDLKGKVTVESNEEAEVREIRLELWCEESIKKTKVERDDEGKESEHTYWDSATLFSTRPNVSGSFRLSFGFKKEYPFIVTIPAGCRESYYSVDANVKWFLKAVIDVKGRRNPTTGTFVIQVTKPTAIPTIIREKQIIQEKIVMIPCAYCRGLMPQTSTFCPNCGARRTA